MRRRRKKRIRNNQENDSGRHVLLPSLERTLFSSLLTLRLLFLLLPFGTERTFIARWRPSNAEWPHHAKQIPLPFNNKHKHTHSSSSWLQHWPNFYILLWGIRTVEEKCIVCHTGCFQHTVASIHNSFMNRCSILFVWKHLWLLYIHSLMWKMSGVFSKNRNYCFISQFV